MRFVCCILLTKNRNGQGVSLDLEYGDLSINLERLWRQKKTIKLMIGLTMSTIVFMRGCSCTAYPLVLPLLKVTCFAAGSSLY